MKILLAFLLLAACAPRDYPCGPDKSPLTDACGRCVKERGSLPRCLNPAYAVPMHCIEQNRDFDPTCRGE